MKNPREFPDTYFMDAPLIAHLKEEDRHRGFRRFALQFAVLINPQVDKHTPATLARASKIAAMVTDVSMSGLCFTSVVDFPLDALLQVDITIGIKTYSLPAIVRRSAALQRPGRTIYECGVQYTKSETAVRFIPILANYLAARGVLRKEQ